MATKKQFETETIRKDNKHFSALKTMIETAFYGNNVRKVESLEEAYKLALGIPNTIVLDQTVANAKDLGLPEDAKVLVENGGEIVGRTARARRIYGKNKKEDEQLLKIVQDALYDISKKPYLTGEAVVGLDEEFMVRANLAIPETEANNLYSWLLNFQIMNEEYKSRYEDSKEYDENDIYILSDPAWEHEDYPNGLAYFDTNHNVAIVLGLQYFGELKKGTLTMAWGTAARQGYVASHGGLKRFLNDGDSYVASFYGLSGSGKSTLTHAKHENKYDVTVLHDDAFIINQDNGSSIALEPAYFDKTSDYPAGHPEQDYFVTVQNSGVTLNEKGERVLVTEDIRNGNGRTVKSRYSTPNRIDRIDEPVDAIYWIMKDETLPPIVKIKDPTVAASMGCTLVTKRSSAENVENVGEVVVEPYANPFRVYPLVDDYEAFKRLFEERDVDCYIINTGSFLGKDIGPSVTLGSIEDNVEKKAEFVPFDSVESFEYLPIPGYEVPFEDEEYRKNLKENMEVRINHLKTTLAEVEAPFDLPDEIVESIQKIVDQIG